MKRFVLFAVFFLLLGWTSVKLSSRWREEREDHRIAILIDWSEVRDWTSRQGMSDETLLERLHHAGVSTLLIGATSLQDYLWQSMTFPSRALADAVRQQLEDRGVAGTSVVSLGRAFRLTNSSINWDRLKDLEVGFNPDLLAKAQRAGLHLVLRVNNDPWLAKDKLFQDLNLLNQSYPEMGFVLNTDEFPGGADALPLWSTFFRTQECLQLLFEFHPAKSAVRLAARVPSSTFRAHTIPSNELKDLTDEQQRSRWRRAVEERSCRFLLFHASPNDSFSSFLDTISSARQDFARRRWEISWPKRRMTWRLRGGVQRELSLLLALLLAMTAPVLALRSSLDKRPWAAFIQVTLLTLLGACVMAALADNPLTRVEIVPFKGTKIAFTCAWLGSFLCLYSWKELKAQLFQAVRRIDVLMGCLLIAIVGYVLIRMGNASAGWKVGWEQGLRDRLEDLFVARPRFKEFAVGYPLLLLGFHLKFNDKTKAFWQEGRFWIGIGMIGPISMVNTFCHIHSPLYLAFWRSFNGFFLGTLIGLGLLGLRKWGEKQF